MHKIADDSTREMSGSSLWNLHRAAVCPSYSPALHHQSGKVGQMLRVREAPVGYWEWWFGSECGTIKGRDGEAGALLSPDLILPWNLFSCVWNERKVPFCRARPPAPPRPASFIFTFETRISRYSSREWRRTKSRRCCGNQGGVWGFKH